MDQEVKRRWVAALRSGRYQQGEKCLAHITPSGNMEYCCLGVLCELAVEQGIISPPEIMPDRQASYVGSRADLPLEVAKWAQLSLRNPKIKLGRADASLAGVNDAHMPFFQIANLIEAQL